MENSTQDILGAEEEKPDEAPVAGSVAPGATPVVAGEAPVTPSRRMLLHACCGPCSLEPTRILQAEGNHIDIFYSNSNIFPPEEYQKRLQTLREWAVKEHVPVIEGAYNPAEWAEATRELAAQVAAGELPREERCRACYRLRLGEAARFAREQGYEAISTTLAVSPYQPSEVIREELFRAAQEAGVEAYFEDFRPFYEEATRRSRREGMYRQNYCGCGYSIAEAEETRAVARAARAAARDARAAGEAGETRATAAEQARSAKAAYAEKQARKKAVLKELRRLRDAD